jgi:hypothetical protein
MTVKFEIGQTYNVDREYGEFITITRRTEKSIWVSVNSGTEERRKLKFADNKECFALNTFTMIFAKPDNLNGCITETINECDVDYQPIDPQYDSPEYHETVKAERSFKVGEVCQVFKGSLATIIERTQNTLTFEWQGKIYKRHIFNNTYNEVVNIYGFYSINTLK